MGCLNGRKLNNEIDTYEKLQKYLLKEDQNFKYILENYNEEESFQNDSHLADKYEISTHLNMLEDLIFHLKKNNKIQNNKNKKNEILKDLIEILDMYENAKFNNFIDIELNKKFQNQVEDIVEREKLK
jgi:hypothetical protein